MKLYQVLLSEREIRLIKAYLNVSSAILEAIGKDHSDIEILIDSIDKSAVEF